MTNLTISEPPLLQQALDLSFDPSEITARYRAERDKRLRSDGNRQYVKAAGKWGAFLDNKFTSTSIERPRVVRDVTVLIVGGGFGALQLAGHLHKEGITDVTIVETGSDFGGTWYWNRYPGAACDTESYVYLPFLEETSYIPSHLYIDSVEILQHAQRIGRHFGLYENALFDTTVMGMSWSEDTARWDIQTDNNDQLTARHVVIAGGDVSKPKLPGFPGIDTFEGHQFHTGRWDYAYTGGDPRSPMSALADKRVAVIGTGASAIQCIPALGKSASHLYVFQRTPSSVAPRDNRPTDPEWVSNLQPGWHEQRRIEYAKAAEGHGGGEDIRDSGFLDMNRELEAAVARIGEKAAAANIDLAPIDMIDLANMSYMETIREHCDTVVTDPATADALKPQYALLCKRPTWNDDFLQTFNRPNVTLADTNGLGVERITPKGVVANGIEYEVDLIVYASGIEVGSSSVFDFVRFPIRGRNGVLIADRWTDEFRTLYGIFVNHMPNYYQMTAMGNGFGPNYLHGNGEQAKLIAHVIRRAEQEGVRSLEATQEAEDEWSRVIANSNDPANGDIKATMRARHQINCTPGYYNAEGNAADKKGILNIVYGGGSFGYFQLLDTWRREGRFAGLTVNYFTADTRPAVFVPG